MKSDTTERPETSKLADNLKAGSSKRKINERCDENSKRVKLLDVSIQQKELQIKYSKIEFENKKIEFAEKMDLLKSQKLQMTEEHELKIQKLKLEIENLFGT